MTKLELNRTAQIAAAIHSMTTQDALRYIKQQSDVSKRLRLAIKNTLLEQRS